LEENVKDALSAVVSLLRKERHLCQFDNNLSTEVDEALSGVAEEDLVRFVQTSLGFFVVGLVFFCIEYEKGCVFDKLS
jgi:hypothetical protein